MKLKSIAVATALALSALGAQALTTSNSSGIFDVPFGELNAYTGSLYKFDSSLGDLTSVKLTLSVKLKAGKLEVVSFPGTAAGSFTDASVSVPVTVSWFDTQAKTIEVSADGFLDAGSVNACGVHHAGPCVRQFNLDEDRARESLKSHSLDALNIYSGSASDTFSFSAWAGDFETLARTTDTDLLFGGDGHVNGKFTVTYQYTSAVPEPATMWLMAGGMLLIGARLRQRRQN
ncbi:MAG: hypothetical protein B7Y51_04730 [Burkholderiales bacterium 28-67-8]|nr:MAG: hypothetical protein B7Y51_04730 [Burkholderiales bacterium 28-67-8]